MSTDPAPSTPPEQDSARYVTRNFRDLQGYRVLPWVPVLLLWGGSESGLLRGAWWGPTFLASIVAAIGATLWIGAWYRANYGEVVRSWDRGRKRTLIGGVAVVAAAWIILFWLGATDRCCPAETVWSPGGLLMGVALILMTVLAGGGPIGRRLHAPTLLFGVGFVVASLVPIGRWVDGGIHPLNDPGWIWIVLGLSMLVAGITSHRLLDRLLAASEAPER